jgi:hypothetical protein
VDVLSGHQFFETFLFRLTRAVGNVGENAHEHLSGGGRDGELDAHFVDVLAGDGIGDEVEVDLFEEGGGPDGAVKGMGILGGFEGHFHEFLYLVGPCCREGKVVWESGEGYGEEDGWERCFRCQTQEHRASCSCSVAVVVVVCKPGSGCDEPKGQMRGVGAGAGAGGNKKKLT